MRLILMRHAKSDWGGQGDHDRPLNPRGQRTAPRVAAALKAAGWVPDVVLSSDSTRTHETWLLMADTFPEADVRFERRLYLADAPAIFAALATVGEAQTVLLLGHNPGMSAAASHVARQYLDLKTADAVLLETQASTWAEAATGPFSLSAVQSARSLDD
jgi:phosphohistidine phosphatase